MEESEQPDIWFVYDGECPICQLGAGFFRVKENIGSLYTVDARSQHDHPVMAEVNQAGLNLDDGMVIKYEGQLYHGVDALHLMAEIGGDQDILNKVNGALFKSRTLSGLCYPFMRGGRNIALKLKGVGKIRNLER